MPHAAELLRSVLDGLDELFTRTGFEFWDEQVRKVATFKSPTRVARAYASMSQGSASGTFHDRIISAFNHDPVTVRQEPYVNALLATFRSIGLACVDAITSNGADAHLEQPTADAASEYWERWQRHDVRSRWHTVVTGVRCRTCDSRYLLDNSPDWAAARRWSLTTAPA